MVLKDHQNEEVIWMKNFLSAETTAKHAWSSYHTGKKCVPTPTSSNSSIFPLWKDVVHTPDLQHHLIKLCIEYRNTLNPRQVTPVDFSDQLIYALSKIIQWKYPELSFPKYFALFGALHIEKESLIANEHLVAGTELDEILGDTSIDIAGLQTATIDVNHIHKARYTVQLSVVSMYTCLKKAHKASNSVFPLFSLAVERCSSSRMFKYWMLIMKFQINYLVFIRSMREGNFKLFVEILISLAKGFSFSIITIMLDGYPCTFKICWVYLSHALNSVKNLIEEILLSRFQVESFHEFIMTKLTNKVTRQLSLSKGQSILWIV